MDSHSLLLTIFSLFDSCISLNLKNLLWYINTLKPNWRGGWVECLILVLLPIINCWWCPYNYLIQWAYYSTQVLTYQGLSSQLNHKATTTNNASCWNPHQIVIRDISRVVLSHLLLLHLSLTGLLVLMLAVYTLLFDNLRMLLLEGWLLISC